MSTAAGLEFSTLILWLTLAVPLAWIFAVGAFSLPGGHDVTHTKSSYGSTAHDIGSVEDQTASSGGGSEIPSYLSDVLSPSYLSLGLTTAVILGWAAVFVGLA